MSETTKPLSFGLALEEAKKGKLIARKGWNGKNMFVFFRPQDDLPLSVVMKAVSIPEEVKKYYEFKHKDIMRDEQDQIKVRVTGYLCMKAADDTIVNGWLASQTDMLALDWQVVDPTLVEKKTESAL